MAPLSHPSAPGAGSRRAPGPVTVGIDVGTTSVKAVAVDEDGRCLRRVRVPHRVHTPDADRLEHDAREAWVEGPRAALAAVAGEDGQDPPVAVAVAAMTPSVTAVDAAGLPLAPGVLYGDERGRVRGGAPSAEPGPGHGASDCRLDPTASGEAAALLAWMAREVPHAAGYWPAQAVANRALGGPGCTDYASACSCGSLFDGVAWDVSACARAGVEGAALPLVAMFGAAVGTVPPGLLGPCAPGAGPVVLGAGSVDGLCEQMVAGADTAGDVLVVCGSTLVVWVAVEGWPERPGLWTLPHLRHGMAVVGGASNAGGLFVDWVDRLVAPAADGAPPPAPASVPVWWPYLRGERVPLHDATRRAALGGLDITAGPAEVRRAAREASAFAVRHILEAAGAPPRRVVVSGGGARDRSWMQALADALDVAVEPVAVPEGAALGAAWLARMAAGLETTIEGAARWARPGREVVPDRAWTGPTADRYQRYRDGIVEGGVLRVG